MGKIIEFRHKSRTAIEFQYKSKTAHLLEKILKIFPKSRVTPISKNIVKFQSMEYRELEKFLDEKIAEAKRSGQKEITIIEKNWRVFDKVLNNKNIDYLTRSYGIYDIRV
jgi:hypothetical protein